tara:strand:- start:371 stop:565 length:195 start_codon:yes stop_codon:yes gene_type:complete
MSFQNNGELAFEFRLAKDLKMTVDNLRKSMSVMEFESWKLYYIDINKKEHKANTEAKAQSKLRR